MLFRDPLDPVSNPLADAEMYFSIDAVPTDAEPAGAVNTGIIGMRDGPAVGPTSLFEMPMMYSCDKAFVICLDARWDIALRNAHA